MDDEKLLAILLADEKWEPLRIICHEGIPFSTLHLTHFLQDHGVNRCTANLFKTAGNWDKSSLKIQWNAESKVFTVEFVGKGTINPKFEKFLSQSMPIYIARSSACECGQALQLGDYQVNSANDDFRFEGCYFCPICKAKLAAEGKGIRNRIARWFSRLRKVQITTAGVDIEM